MRWMVLKLENDTHRVMVDLIGGRQCTKKKPYNLIKINNFSEHLLVI